MVSNLSIVATADYMGLAAVSHKARPHSRRKPNVSVPAVLRKGIQLVEANER
jgi:hypothetical protein